MSDRLRILHLVSYPLYSGPVVPTLGLAQAQRALGHQVWLACDSKRGAFNDYEEAAAPHLAPAGLDPPVSLTLSTKSSPLEYLRDLTTLRTLLSSGRLDVVHSHLSHDHGLLALSGPGRPAVVRVRTLHSERSLAHRFGQAWLTRRADGWVVRCREHARRLVDGFRVPGERVRVIPGSIDSERFAPPSPAARAAARQRFGLPADAPVVIHAALIAGRGQEELVDAVAASGVAAPQLLFAGRGEHEAALRARVQSRGLESRVRFAGYLSGDELLVGYAAADLAFVAQPGNDASARAALEAMASGLPVLAVHTGALAELVDAEVGYPLATRQSAAIAAAVREWLSTPDRGRARGAAGRARVVRERAFATEAAATLALYADLTERR